MFTHTYDSKWAVQSWLQSHVVGGARLHSTAIIARQDQTRKDRTTTGNIRRQNKTRQDKTKKTRQHKRPRRQHRKTKPTRRQKDIHKGKRGSSRAKGSYLTKQRP